MTLNQAIHEYNDSDLLQYLQEEIENRGKYEEVMQLCYNERGVPCT